MNESGEILSDIGNLILANAEAALEQGGLAVPTDVFLSHLKPPDDCCDWLAVWIQQIVPSTEAQFPRQVVEVNPKCGEMDMAVDYRLGIIRDCWPSLRKEGDKPVFPDPDEVQTAADDLAIVARVLWCGLVAAYHAGQLLPPISGNHTVNDTLDVSWGPMTPSRGGGCAGWQWQIVVHVPSCCWEAPPLGSGS